MARKGYGAIFSFKTIIMFKSHIQWCDYTHNFWHGCRKLGIECAKCYLYRDKRKQGQDASIIHRLLDQTFFKPLFWQESGRVFTCSYSDFFLEQADSWREDAWDVIRRTPKLTRMILTKRPERIKACLPPDWGDGWDNCARVKWTKDKKEFIIVRSYKKPPRDFLETIKGDSHEAI